MIKSRALNMCVQHVAAAKTSIAVFGHNTRIASFPEAPLTIINVTRIILLRLYFIHGRCVVFPSVHRRH